MSSTHLSLHYHVIFGTKNRVPHIAPDWQDRLHALLGGTVRHLDAVPEAVGGVADHVHVLMGLKATHCLADVMRDLKRASSQWVHQTMGLAGFAWQDGYGAFTISAPSRKKVAAYIAGQAEHHRTRSFRAEYIKMLRRAGVPFEERFLD